MVRYGRIIHHIRLLKPGGILFGIHGEVDTALERLSRNGYTDIEVEAFNEAVTFFPSESEFAKFLSDIPGNPDYSLPEYREEVARRARESRIDGRLGIRERKFIWKAVRP